jgi:hypothetical protein
VALTARDERIDDFRGERVAARRVVSAAKRLERGAEVVNALAHAAEAAPRARARDQESRVVWVRS